jgi:hypothetical protein
MFSLNFFNKKKSFKLNNFYSISLLVYLQNFKRIFYSFYTTSAISKQNVLLRNRFKTNIKGFNIIHKHHYHRSISNYCYWKFLLDKLTARDVKITNKMQFLSLNKQINKDLNLRNQKILNFYLSKEKINKFQYKMLSVDNHKKFLTMGHPGFIWRDKNQIYFIAQTSHGGSIRGTRDFEQIKLADKKILYEAEVYSIVKIEGKFYFPVIYDLGDVDDLEIYKFEELHKMSNLEIEKFLKTYNNNIDITRKIVNYQDYFDFYNSLEALSIYNNEIDENKNSILDILKINKKDEE